VAKKSDRMLTHEQVQKIVDDAKRVIAK
jgi:hypothetical protein